MTQDTKCSGDTKANRPAPTMWAQRLDHLIITFNVNDCKNPQVLFDPEKVTFICEDSSGKTSYNNEIVVHEEIKPSNCSWARKGWGVECKVQKKTAAAWPRLTKDKGKIHWLKTDFKRWKDLDSDSEEEMIDEDTDLSKMMAQMGAMPEGVPDMSDMNDMDDDDSVDSDDSDIPELETNEKNDAEEPAAAKA